MTRRVAQGTTPQGGSLDSSCLSSFNYNKEMQRLTVSFAQSGRFYTYFGVPDSKVTGLRQANSKGQYFNKYIKNVYPFARSARP